MTAFVTNCSTCPFMLRVEREEDSYPALGVVSLHLMVMYGATIVAQKLQQSAQSGVNLEPLVLSGNH